MVLMISVALTAILLASSATVIVSPITTSRLTGAISFVKPVVKHYSFCFVYLWLHADLFDYGVEIHVLS